MSMWYVARLAWKKKDGRRVSFLNAQIVGSPLISHGKSDVASWGATSLNPDITDLYAEYVKDGKYLSDDGNSWEPI
jgi:acyl-homoserine lactone acylase PvdQ